MKATLTFNLPDEEEQFSDAINGSKYKEFKEEVWNSIFRGRHKHGYQT